MYVPENISPEVPTDTWLLSAQLAGFESFLSISLAKKRNLEREFFLLFGAAIDQYSLSRKTGRELSATNPDLFDSYLNLKEMYGSTYPEYLGLGHGDSSNTKKDDLLIIEPVGEAASTISDTTGEIHPFAVGTGVRLDKSTRTNEGLIDWKVTVQGVGASALQYTAPFFGEDDTLITRFRHIGFQLPDGNFRPFGTE